MNKSILIESKTVFAPRGTATYTPKWSIVVLAVACLGVLKFNGPGAKTPVGHDMSLGETVAAAPRAPALKNTSSRVPPIARSAETNSIGTGIVVRHRDKNTAENK